MIIDNIYKYLDYKGITAYEISKKIGISNGYLAKTKQKKGNVGGQILEKIVSYYPDLNPTWLLTGKGHMLKEEKRHPKEEESSGKTLERAVAAYGSAGIKECKGTGPPEVSTDKGVPYFDVDFIGGFDLVFNDQTIAPSFYIDFSPFNDADYWVNITGQSMAPIISNGDLVALKRVENWHEFILFGEIYALVTDEFRTIKVVNKGQDKEHFNLVPYNKSSDFFDQQIPKRLVRYVFKVKGSIKKFF